jgi:nucleotide-binding universal stress UspA family protein
MANTIVVGYDGSRASKAALEEAVDIAGGMDNGLIVIACGHDRTPGYVGYDGEPLWKSAIELEKIWEGMEAKIEEDLGEAAKTVEAAGVKAATVCSRGKPAAIVVDVAREMKARMIVVGSRGAGKVEETTVLGSTTTELLHTAHVPVLVVPS